MSFDVFALPARGRDLVQRYGTLTQMGRLQIVDTICSWRKLMLGAILVIILIILLIGALPSWPYSSGWGYYPSGGLGLVIVILLILVLMGRI
jgi:Protein of unknown function (DUF3309)